MSCVNIYIFESCVNSAPKDWIITRLMFELMFNQAKKIKNLAVMQEIIKNVTSPPITFYFCYAIAVGIVVNVLCACAGSQ